MDIKLNLTVRMFNGNTPKFNMKMNKNPPCQFLDFNRHQLNINLYLVFYSNSFYAIVKEMA